MSPATPCAIASPRMTLMSRLRLRPAAAGLISLIWLSGAVWKFLSADEFRRAVRAHQVLPQWTDAAWFIVPAAKLTLAAAIGVLCGGALSSRRDRLTARVSLAVLVVFTGYLMLVPAKRLEAAGCGCHGVQTVGMADWLGSPTKPLIIAVNILFGLAHVPLARSARVQDIAGP